MLASPTHLLLLVLTGLALLLPAASSAAEPENAVAVVGPADEAAPGEEGTVTVLPEVVVVGVTGVPVIAVEGQSALSAETIGTLPLADGSLTEALTGLPGIQYSETTNSSLTAGEILPPPVSIAGGRVEENTFLIDGFGTDSRLDPLQPDGTSGQFVQGHPQGLFVHSSLLDSVTVHDSNVSAAYGGFTGGVVEAELRRPGDVFAGEMFYRTTRDAWTSFHLAPGSQAAFEASRTQAQQPRFTKHDGGVRLDLPLTKKAGLLLAYQQTYSAIPLLHIQEVKTQTRRSENYLMRLGLAPGQGARLDLTLLYTPYVAELFRKDTQNSDFTTEMGGWLLGADYRQDRSWGGWRLQTGYTRQVNRREAPPHLMTGWNRTLPDTSWGTLVGTSTSFEGMIGDIALSQQSLQVKTSLHLEPLSSGPFRHRLNAGLDLEQLRGEYDRPYTSYNYFTPVLAPTVQCGADDPACRPGQYLRQRTVFPANHSAVTVQRADIYLEDTIDWGRLQWRPGVRVSYNDFLENVDVAPRLAAGWDILGDGTTVLTAGANRYYGQELLTLALRRKLLPTAPLESRTIGVDANGDLLNVWTGTTGSGEFVVRDLKTPYKDEWTVGLQQALGGGRLEARYIHRRGVDEFAYEVIAVPKERALNNNGRSRYDAVLAGWEKTWERHYLNVNLTYAESYTGTPDYTTAFEDDELAKRVWYDNELLRLDELPWPNYNRSWVANVTYTARLPYGLTLGSLGKYRGAYKKLVDSKVNSPIDGNDIYILSTQPSTLTFDGRLDWALPGFGTGQQLTLSLEVYNVFDVRTEVGGVSDEYNLGRQFWLGGRYSF